MNVLRCAAVGVTVVEMCVLIVYYIPLVAQVPWLNLSSVNSHAYDDNFVSDLLFRNMTYKYLLSVLVALQLLVCGFFVVALNWKGSAYTSRTSCGVMVFELFCLLVACIGWFVLTSIYTDESGKLTVGHIVGAVIFIAACGLYFVMMILNVADLYNFKFNTKSECCTFGSAVVFFVLSTVFGFVFVASFFGNDVSYGWMYEHSSFILLIGAHVLLFVADSLLASDVDARKSSSSVFERSQLDLVRINSSDVRLF